MPTRKIRDLPLEHWYTPWPPCQHPEHNPPSHMVFEPGVYEHTCPGCGRQLEFVVHGTWCSNQQGMNLAERPSPYDAGEGGAKVLKKE